MPIKGNNITPPAKTKTIYINWEEREVYSQEAYEEHLNDTMAEMLEDEALLGEWLSDNLNYRETGRLMLSQEYRAEMMAEYENYCRGRIEDDEEGEWEEVKVTF